MLRNHRKINEAMNEKDVRGKWRPEVYHFALDHLRSKKALRELIDLIETYETDRNEKGRIT